MKKNRLFVVLILLIILLVVLGSWAVCKYKEKIWGDKFAECRVDEDCVKSNCCHADSCVIKSKEPKCEGVICTMDCKLNTFDCGQGSCVCSDGVCGVKWNEK